MGKYKVPLEKRKEREKKLKSINFAISTLMLYLLCLFISIFVGVGAFTLFFAAGEGVGSSLMLSSGIAGFISSFITLLFFNSRSKPQKN